MSQATIGTKIILDGEKEYRAALRDIDTELKTLGTELKLSAEQYADNAGSVDALSGKSEILQKQLEAQRQKVATLQGALESANETYGEGSRKSQEWQQKLNLAQADLLKMERSLNQTAAALEEATENTEDFSDALKDSDDGMEGAAEQAEEYKSALEKAGKASDEAESSTKDFGDVLGTISEKLGIKLPDSVRASVGKLGNLSSGFMAAAAAAAAVVTAVVKVEKALVSMTVESAKAAEQLSNAASSGGLSLESAQEWDYVLKSVGSSLESATGDLASFQQKITEAATGSGESAELFSKLRISVTDTSGALKTTEQLLPELVNKFQRMGDETERNTIANKLLGGTGTALIPILKSTGTELDALIADKQKLGILSEQEVADLERTAAAQRKYEEAIASSKEQLSAQFAPAVTDFYDASADAISSLSQLLKNSGILEFAKDLLGFVTKLIQGFADMTSKTGDWANKMRSSIEGLQGPMETLALFADTLGVVAGLLQLITGDFSGGFDTIKTHLGFNERHGKQSYLQSWWSGGYNSQSVYDEELGAWVGNGLGNASGSDYWTGGVTWVGENGPEKVYLPEGSRIQTAQESRAETVVYNITIPAKDIKEFNDIVRIAKNARRAERMGMA